MLQYDVKSAHRELSGEVLAGRARLKGLVISPGETPGDIIFRNQDVAGAILLQININANDVTVFSVNVPGDGIVFDSGMYVTLPAGTKVTVFYG